MSKLTDAMRYFVSRPRSAFVPPAAKLKYTELSQEYSDAQNYIGYRFEAKFGIYVMISEVAAAEALEHVLEQVRRQVAEEIFGEYRDALLSIQTLAYTNNVPSIAHIARDMERSMFSV